jgi:glycerate kinase
MRSINVDSKNGNFEGTLRVYVNNVEHLDFLMHKMKNIKGIQHVSRAIIDENSNSTQFDERFSRCFCFCDAIEKGLRISGITNIEKLPLADGGDGTAAILANVYNANIQHITVCDPLERKIESGYYLTPDSQIAIIGMADASGLHLLKRYEYSATQSTSYGTGELINGAIEAGAKTIIIGLGGSATVDGGMGALMALGVRFYGHNGEIKSGCGLRLGDVLHIDRTDALLRLKNVELILLTDVKTPMTGINGAAKLFGPQKGATEGDVEILSKNLDIFAQKLFQETKKDVSFLPGGGSAGGIAASFHALLVQKSKKEQVILENHLHKAIHEFHHTARQN